MDPRARKVVSYADISPSIPDEAASITDPASNARPAKRPRISDPPIPSSSTPLNFTGKALNGQPKKKQKKDPKSWQTSRTLTHEEIWDDSALINAWDAAMEEYRAINGEDKGWMEDPAKQSALWWNTQPSEEELPIEEEGEDEYPEDGVEADADIEETDAELLISTIDIPTAPTTYPTMSSAQVASPVLPFPSTSSTSILEQLPEDPEKVLELAVQSYYWAGYLMGRRDELLRRRPAAPVEAVKASKPDQEAGGEVANAEDP
ncbi:hypothetical protein DACRYDRAFT_118243 [Dacryopinax primogenitus]|uniref:Survival Motor Neuron Gemin2-binding domain-containing protein n=1 Tax=Dacryopinax primogenitus (strain DJM 731) TaxID=1858805 RepID=M5FZE0_DACPD|nr:uncharacterized protein DACRYDRAFT_118243 [Dacryopinax primogenitus]EJT98936.1 hypothetical protein DACRYDRAFT_118243 [Dacryopinax primogenitus]